MPVPPLPRHRTLIVGILNVTPDSFSDGSSEALDPDGAVERGLRLLADGADVIDVGGESTRPGFEAVDIAAENDRVLPVIEGLVRQAPHARISIDTRKPDVAERALRAGATILNAYGGLDEPAMAAVAKRHGCSVIAYHTDSVRELSDEAALAAIRTFFLRQDRIMNSFGETGGELILDPGLGFGKSLSQTVFLMNRLEELGLGVKRPLLIGISRKQHLGTLLQRELGLQTLPGPLERLEAGLAEAAIAVTHGASLVRTHDVAATRKFMAVFDAVRASLTTSKE